MPSYWLKTYVACHNRPIEFVINDSILVCVANKHLNQANKKENKKTVVRKRSLTIGGGGAGGREGRYYFKSEGPKILATLTFWVFECCIARIHISVTLRQLFHWNKKVLLFTIFSGVEAESFESWYWWFLSFFTSMIHHFLPDSWFTKTFDHLFI